MCVCFFFYVFHVVRKVDEATNFAFVQLTEQQPSLSENSHPQGQSGFGVGKNFLLHEGNWCFLIKTYNKITILSSLIKATKLIHYHRCYLQGIM